jgi:hypothetical protein
VKTCKDSWLSRGQKWLDSVRRFIIKQPRVCVGQIILAELLICIVTVAVVHACDSAGERWCIKAYIDPGTGSLIIQVLIAGLVGIIYLIKVFWRNIKEYLLKLLRKIRGTKKADET